MTDLIYLCVTLAAFAGLAFLAGALDRVEQRANRQTDR